MAAIRCLASSISCFDGFPWRTVDSNVVIFDVSPASRAFTHLVIAAFLCVAADLRLLFPFCFGGPWARLIGLRVVLTRCRRLIPQPWPSLVFAVAFDALSPKINAAGIESRPNVHL